MEIMTIESNAYRLLVEKIEKITAYVEESRNREETERKRKEEAESPVTKGRKADPKWMTHKEVCEALDISHRTLQRYRSIGALPYKTLGKKTYYSGRYAIPGRLSRACVSGGWWRRPPPRSTG
jgi:hypothetical protein